jgi:hypothetical protein
VRLQSAFALRDFVEACAMSDDVQSGSRFGEVRLQATKRSGVERSREWLERMISVA